MSSFISPSDQELTARFLEDGYVIQDVEDFAALDYLHTLAAPHEPPVEGLNELKLAVMKKLNASKFSRVAYYQLAKEALHALVGNELAMQKKFNINVQVPNDEKNLLPIHADTWTGDSAFQVVVWVPLVDCYRTKSMWILPPQYAKGFKVEGSSEEMFRRIEPHIRYLEIKYGEVLIFNSTLPHGNRVNREDTTRWSLNCRFKGAFTPYASKGLGEHFEPITLRAASKIGLAYKHPL